MARHPEQFTTVTENPAVDTIERAHTQGNEHREDVIDSSVETREQLTEARSTATEVIQGLEEALGPELVEFAIQAIDEIKAIQNHADVIRRDNPGEEGEIMALEFVLTEYTAIKERLEKEFPNNEKAQALAAHLAELTGFQDQLTELNKKHGPSLTRIGVAGTAYMTPVLGGLLGIADGLRGRSSITGQEYESTLGRVGEVALGAGTLALDAAGFVSVGSATGVSTAIKAGRAGVAANKGIKAARGAAAVKVVKGGRGAKAARTFRGVDGAIDSYKGMKAVQRGDQALDLARSLRFVAEAEEVVKHTPKLGKALGKAAGFFEKHPKASSAAIHYVKTSRRDVIDDAADVYGKQKAKEALNHAAIEKMAA